MRSRTISLTYWATALHQPFKISAWNGLADIGIRAIQNRKTARLSGNITHHFFLSSLRTHARAVGLHRIDDRLITSAATIVTRQMIANLFAIRSQAWPL